MLAGGEYEHDEQYEKVFVHGQGEANEDGMEHDSKLQDGNADYLSEGRVRSGAGGRGSFHIPFLVVNMVATASGATLCKGG